MRISDWSSDVCSSDLASGRSSGGRAGIEPGPRERRLRAGARGRPTSCWSVTRCAWCGGFSRAAKPGKTSPAAQSEGRDRKSVGEGKSVAGRVDLGGCRFLKKKNKKKRKRENKK